jgi:hypothetical protein
MVALCTIARLVAFNELVEQVNITKGRFQEAAGSYTTQSPCHTCCLLSAEGQDVQAQGQARRGGRNIWDCA